MAGQVDFYTMLSGLGDTIAAKRKDAARREAFANSNNPDGTVDFQKAILGLTRAGDVEGAARISQLAGAAEDRKFRQSTDARDFAFRQQESRRAQQNADRSYGLQERAAVRADEGPEEVAAQRAAAAKTYGVDPSTPTGRSFVLTGKLPENDTSMVDAVNQRKAAAISNGLDPSSPGFQSFVLTGKMPREDAQPLTATDKKAILEADEMVLTNQSAIDSLRKAKDLSPKAYAGPYADKRGYVTSFLGESSDLGKAGIATTDLNNLVTSNALGQLKAIFGGAPTEGERKILLDIQGSASLPDQVRQKIYDRAIELANKRLEFNRRRAEELRGNQYYKPQNSMSRAPVAQSQGITQAEYEKLPSGAKFIDPEGNERVKP